MMDPTEYLGDAGGGSFPSSLSIALVSFLLWAKGWESMRGPLVSTEYSRSEEDDRESIG